MIDTDQKQEAFARQSAAKLSQMVDATHANQCATPAQGYSPAPEPLAAQLGRRLARDTEELNNLNRAQGILMRHPEYEELLWLLRSGLV